MLKLPPGFDYSALLSDFFVFSTPFISISFIFAAFYIIRRSFKYI